MIDELKRLENAIFKIGNHTLSDISGDNECADYFGGNFMLDNRRVKFRKAKITPKKVGQFVTLWKRNANNQTEPYSVHDAFDFYVIVAEENDQFGFFLFPKNVLNVKQILTNGEIPGKRGFRVYPDWTATEHKQAERTKAWQKEYFINLNDKVGSMQKFNLIFTSNY